jgi:hypothetical protein
VPEHDAVTDKIPENEGKWHEIEQLHRIAGNAFEKIAHQWRKWLEQVTVERTIFDCQRKLEDDAAVGEVHDNRHQ